MKTELESQDIEAIAERVIELIKPVLSSNGRQGDEDIVFDVKGLAQSDTGTKKVTCIG